MKVLAFVFACVLTLSATWASGKPGTLKQYSLKQGIEYQSVDIQALQADDFQNPGMLAVDLGERAFAQTLGEDQPACASCHDDLSGVAATFPKLNSRLGKVVSLSSQVMACRSEYQQAKPEAYESELVQALSAYVANQSRGIPFEPIPQNLKGAYERGKAYYHKRKGQLNLGCVHCHENNPGRLLRGDIISQGVSTGYPVYRLEWQSVGSLHRRFRACDIGVRAEPAAIGGPIYTDLELYLRGRAGSLPITAPAVRR